MVVWAVEGGFMSLSLLVEFLKMAMAFETFTTYQVVKVSIYALVGFYFTMVIYSAAMLIG